MAESKTPVCLVCDRSNHEIPLIPLLFGESQFYICPQHLPVLIHEPSQLAGKLPGAENLGAAEGHDHH